jgi:hypothetical protein
MKGSISRGWSEQKPSKISVAPDIQSDFRALLDGGLSARGYRGKYFCGEDPILPSSHRLGAIMAMGMMGAAAATQIFYRMRGGEEQDLSVDLKKSGRAH